MLCSVRLSGETSLKRSHVRETQWEGRRRPCRQQIGSFWAEGTTGAKVQGHSAPGRAERQEKDGRVSSGERGEGEVRR